MITFNHEELNDVLAYIVENDVLLAAVGDELKKVPNVTVVNEAKIRSYGLPKDKEEVTKVDLENGTSYTCNLLVRKMILLNNSFEKL